MGKNRLGQWVSQIIPYIMLLIILLFPFSAKASTTVGEIEYDDNSLTPTEQQAGSSGGGINLNPLDWDWGSIGGAIGDFVDGVIDGAIDLWDGFLDFLGEVGQMFVDLWDSLPDWAKDLIITIGIIVAVVAGIVLLVVGGIISVAVAVVAAVVAIIAGIVYFAMYGGTDAFNPLHAAIWIVGGALAGGLLAFAVEAGAIGLLLQGLRTGLGYAGLGLRTAFQFIWTRGLVPAFQAIRAGIQFAWARGIVPAFQAIRTGIQAAWTRGIVPAFQAIRTAIQTTWATRILPFLQSIKTAFGSFLAANGGWAGLLKIGFVSSGVSIGFDLLTGETDIKKVFVNATIAFFGGIFGAGVWTKIRSLSGFFKRFGLVIYSGTIGSGLEVVRQWIIGDGINWAEVGIGALVFGTLIPAKYWMAGLSQAFQKTSIPDFMEKFATKFITNFYKDIIYWNDPKTHPDNGLRNYLNSWTDFINNVKFEFTSGYKNWMWKLFKIHIP